MSTPVRYTISLSSVKVLGIGLGREDPGRVSLPTQTTASEPDWAATGGSRWRGLGPGGSRPSGCVVLLP